MKRPIPTRDRLLTVDIAANAGQDAVGNASLVATQFTIISDQTGSTPTITAAQSSPTSETPINVSVDFGEAVSGFVVSEVSVGNGSVVGFSTADSRIFTFDVVPSGQGTITVDVAEDVARDGAGNDSLAAAQFAIEFGSIQSESLQAGGGTYELLVIDDDVVLRRQGAEELLRLATQPGQAFVINGSTGDDELIVDLSVPPGVEVTFNGGDGFDSLTVTGGSFEKTTVSNTGAADGLIEFDGYPVAFTGLEPIDLTGVTSASMSVLLPDTPDNALLEPTGGMLTLSSLDDSPTFESVRFATPSRELMIDAGGGNDRVSAETVTTPVIIVGGPGNDTLTGGQSDDILRGGDGDDEFDGGPGHDMIGGRSSGEPTNSVLVTVDTRFVSSPTSTDGNGHVAVLPPNLRYLDEWDDLVVEIWGSTPVDTTTSIGSFSVDVPFDSTLYEALPVEFGPGFTGSRQSTIDNVNGVVSGISATTPVANIGRDEFVLMARVSLRVKAGVDLANNASGRYILPTVDERLTVNGVRLDTADGDESDSNEPIPATARIWPVMYDLDDSGVIGFGDVALFAATFGDSTTANDNSFSRDFDRSGVVGFGDVALFAQNFGRSRSSTGQQSYSGNFPNAWEPAGLLADHVWLGSTAAPESQLPLLTQSILRELQSAAVDRFDDTGLTAAELDALRSVDIRVQDLPDGYLGLATDDAIIIDVDASGVGWFIDETPRDDVEFSAPSQTGGVARNRYDLLTVIAHELGHHLGWEHESEGHMSDQLEPGQRRLPELVESDGQFAAFSEFDELLGLK